MPITLEKVDCSRGAPMGRYAAPALDKSTPKSISLARVRLDSGGYDSGGAYWGVAYNGNRLYCAQDAHGNQRFVRATHRERAALMLGLASNDLTKGLTAHIQYGLAVLDGRAPMPDGLSPKDVVKWLQDNGAAMGQTAQPWYSQTPAAHGN